MIVFPGANQAVEPSKERADWWVALLLAMYLVVLQVILVHVSVCVWMGPETKMFTLVIRIEGVPNGKLGFFQDLVLASCAAGLGGAVFMVREFYINYCFGRERIAIMEQTETKVKQDKQRVYLQAEHMPRYVLLPISSTILGPIVLSLLTAGTISLEGSQGISRHVIVIVCFVLGYAYHDTLKFMADLSRIVMFRGT